MPLVDVEVVCPEGRAPALPGADALAAALGRALASPPGRTWVRLHVLDPRHYGENDAALQPDALPVFVRILHAHPPAGRPLHEELDRVTRAVAGVLSVASDRVHVEYAPAGAGRVAFGGRLVE